MSDELGAVRVRGLKELNRVLLKGGPELRKQVRASAREVAEPVRRDAEKLAVEEISGLERRSAKVKRPPWSRMRVGVTQASVYVAPVKRGTKVKRRQRPNLKELLLEKAMEPALEQHADELEALVAAHVDRLWEQGAVV